LAAGKLSMSNLDQSLTGALKKCIDVDMVGMTEVQCHAWHG